MYLIVGLGNPGERYARNRHNAGFHLIDALAREHGFADFAERHGGLMSRGRLAGQDIILFKPMHFMNRSGIAVSEAARFYKIGLEQIIVCHDELDIAPGKVKIKQGGGAGGHNGIKSIDSHLGHDYWRLRIGIGHPGEASQVSGYVLSDFTPDQWQEEQTLIGHIATLFPLWLADGHAAFLNRLALRIGKV